MNFEKFGFLPADILIPQNTDLSKWSVVACDQYTSNPDYWEKVSNASGDEPSALNIIFPEVYLNNHDSDERIKNINGKMSEYLNSGLFKEYKNSFVYIKRTCKNGAVREGLLGVVDLLKYDFNKGSVSEIRATEGTVLDRIPPRVKIRKDAPLELPHIMLLIDDEGKTVIEPLSKNIGEMEKLYDFELMMGGGSIEGYLLNEKSMDNVEKAFEKLFNKEAFTKKYGVENILEFAVGDGNHSLATAKTCYENICKELPYEEAMVHPARYALVELVNIHSPALEFEAIHRVVFDCNAKDVLEEFKKYYKTNNSQGQKIEYIINEEINEIYVENPKSFLAVDTLQSFIDDYLKTHSGSVDYIHGKQDTVLLTAQKNTIGFLLPSISKSELFEYIIKKGVLPRKTFSMGEADDKRYYLEARKIK